jgi:hypothetical protein
MEMHDLKASPLTREKLSENVLKEWQNLIDITAEIFHVPAGLITRVDGNQIEILLKSNSEGNPYTAGYTTQYPNSGWYCEYTLKTRKLNLIPNALLDLDWRDNGAVVGFNMISYVGMPIQNSDGGEFGTVCFLDNKANPHNDLHIKILTQVKRMIELSLRIINDKEVMDRQQKLIHDLSKIYPICSYCKKVRETSGAWVEIEKYVKDVSGTMPSHGICPNCKEREMKLFRREINNLTVEDGL